MMNIYTDNEYVKLSAYPPITNVYYSVLSGVSADFTTIYVTSTNQIVYAPLNNFSIVASNSTANFIVAFDGFRQVSFKNNFDIFNINNCYLSAYNFVNTVINNNPIFVTNYATISTNANTFYTFNYKTTGSAIIDVFFSELVPTPTITPTPTVTPSITQTPTVTLTNTPTITLTVTQTNTPTNTVTPSITPSVTPTNTPTNTPTKTVTPTITPTPSFTPIYNGIYVANILGAGTNLTRKLDSTDIDWVETGGSVFILSGNTVYAGGRNTAGKLGLGITAPSINNFIALTGNWSNVKSKSERTYFLSAGTYKWYVAGNNYGGWLGLGYTTLDTALSSPVQLPGDWSRLVLGVNGVYGLSAYNNKWYSWGLNFYGELNTSQSQIITAGVNQIPGDWDDVVFGSSTVFLKSMSGQWYGGGYNGSGALGIGNFTNITAFVPITGSWSKIVCAEHTLALSAGTNKMYGTGWNIYAQLGLGDYGSGTNRNTFQPIFGDWSDIKVNTYSSFALSANTNEWFGCGFNSYGTLGITNIFTQPLVFTNINSNNSFYSNLPKSKRFIPLSRDNVQISSESNGLAVMVLSTFSNPTPTPSLSPNTTPTPTPTQTPTVTPTNTPNLQNNVLFNYNSFYKNELLSPYSFFYPALTAAAQRWENFIKISPPAYSVIKNIFPTYTGISLNTVNLVNIPSGYLAACGVTDFVVLSSISGSNKFVTVSFDLYINVWYIGGFFGLTQNDWFKILTHELGHALGLGQYWQSYYMPWGAVPPSNNFLSGSAYPIINTSYNTILSSSRPKIALEAEGGTGTNSAHWENNFRSLTATGSDGYNYPGLTNELMIGFYDINVNFVISDLSIKTMVQFGGYQEKVPGANEGVPTLQTTANLIFAGNNLQTNLETNSGLKIKYNCCDKCIENTPNHMMTIDIDSGEVLEYSAIVHVDE